MELKNLIELNLSNNEIKDEGCSILAEASLLSLEKLNLSSNKITHDGVIYLMIKVTF